MKFNCFYSSIEWFSKGRKILVPITHLSWNSFCIPLSAWSSVELNDSVLLQFSLSSSKNFMI
ncbi:hypothetical protein BpHYR1_034622 [Brachionus plicatilis]|uniref:Uncharacterized protein n=1 Tax=Brachionus plicatilis TaxID=10195 RepID=A0A3M7SZN4_BRAPC|nr:hypothetical protein BpHYR1_034622 [Brachionus plicatilis]